MKKKKLPNDVPYLINFAMSIGLPQSQLSREMELPPTTISNWATGKAKPRSLVTTRKQLIDLIEEKMESDSLEWAEFIERSGEDVVGVGKA